MFVLCCMLGLILVFSSSTLRSGAITRRALWMNTFIEQKSNECEELKHDWCFRNEHYSLKMKCVFKSRRCAARGHLSSYSSYAFNCMPLIMNEIFVHNPATIVQLFKWFNWECTEILLTIPHVLSLLKCNMVP